MNPRPHAAWILLLALACAACPQRHGTPAEGRTQPATTDPAAAPTPQPSTLPAVEVVVEATSGTRLRVRAEVARTDAQRERGLMFRRALAADAGMLFLMPGDKDWTFWMKNTLIPLDLIYADQDGRVVGVVDNARPLDETARKVGVPSRYVLEVNGGWCKRHGVGAGARLVFPKDL